MKNIEEIVGVLRMSLDGPLALWWVSVALVILLAVAFGGLVRRRTRPRLAILALCFSTPVWALLFAWIAVVFSADHQSATAVQDATIPTTVLGVLGIAALVQGIACVAVAKNQRLVASAVAACATWFVFWVYLVAGMSVSGVWL